MCQICQEAYTMLREAYTMPPISWLTAISHHKIIYKESFGLFENKVYAVGLKDHRFCQAHARPNTWTRQTKHIFKTGFEKKVPKA